MATADVSSDAAYETDINDGLGWFDSRWDFDEPIDPAEVVSVRVNGVELPMK